MPTATPDTLTQVLTQVVQEAAQQAAAAPQQLGDALGQALQRATDEAGHAVDEVEQLPADLLQALKDALAPPDWFSILAFLLVRLSELVPGLTVGAWDPGQNWVRALTLTYRDPAVPDSALTVALALFDDHQHAERGVIVRATAALDATPASGAVVSLHLAADGQGEWRIPFAGGITGPDHAATVALAAVVDPHLDAGSTTSAGLGLGPARLAVALASTPAQPVHWQLELGLGDAGAWPGLHADLDLAAVLGSLARVVHIEPVHERYSPTLTLAAGASPKFTLGHAGSDG